MSNVSISCADEQTRPPSAAACDRTPACGGGGGGAVPLWRSLTGGLPRLRCNSEQQTLLHTMTEPAARCSRRSAASNVNNNNRAAFRSTPSTATPGRAPDVVS
ncbi:hypothetical protein EYF80_064636 [Liparis tanakae]|uniref:Uncharacterized protein n=1 Tax=Liparis tanakae TaxID=230148 RepID=A0A4Z2E8J2_9TELE|nr:hypothetical protein EYF80_064636 [Liparis tanakae]